MQPPVTIVAQMADGSHLVEHTEDFGAYVGMVLGFRRDPECVRLEWHATPQPPADDETMYEQAGQAPWNQSTSLDFDLAEAEFQRWIPVA